MAKYHGKVGFVVFEETAPSVSTEVPVEREYFGEVTRNTKRWEASSYLNDNLQVNNLISIVADSYARNNLFAIRYISWMGSNWKVTNVEVQYPRLILTIGGVYNGPTPEIGRGIEEDNDGEGPCVFSTASE